MLTQISFNFAPITSHPISLMEFANENLHPIWKWNKQKNVACKVSLAACLQIIVNNYLKILKGIWCQWISTDGQAGGQAVAYCIWQQKSSATINIKFSFQCFLTPFPSCKTTNRVVQYRSDRSHHGWYRRHCPSPSTIPSSPSLLESSCSVATAFSQSLLDNGFLCFQFQQMEAIINCSTR